MRIGSLWSRKQDLIVPNMRPDEELNDGVSRFSQEEACQ